MGREHDGATFWNAVDVVDENDSELLEPLDDEFVVDDFVIAEDRSRVASDHPGKGLDCHLDAGTKSARSSEQHAVDVHPPNDTRAPESSYVHR